MKIQNIIKDSKVYTSNVYLVTGNWNTLSDLNTLIDVGRDSSIIEMIENASTGVGKRRVEQVILTHSHYDHASLLPIIKKTYNPKVFAFSTNLENVDVVIKGGESIKIGDRVCEIIHTPAHSNDSICIYCEEEKVLFAGDTPLIITVGDNRYEPEFIKALEYICSKDIEIIYFGHGLPLKSNCTKHLLNSLKNIKE